VVGVAFENSAIGCLSGVELKKKKNNGVRSISGSRL
jgi:hypothetical protein